jgi:hypothetical protein
LTLKAKSYADIRSVFTSIPGDVSNDAVGDYAPRLEDIYAPETHAAALDPAIPIVVGSRGAGKSFWSGVLGQLETRKAAAVAYPRLHLMELKVAFGFTGAVGGPEGVSVEMLSNLLPPDADINQARGFWWATILRAAERANGKTPKLSALVKLGRDWEKREEEIASHERRLREEGKVLLVVYDAPRHYSNELAAPQAAYGGSSRGRMGDARISRHQS